VAWWILGDPQPNELSLQDDSEVVRCATTWLQRWLRGS
jgi:hypothetical protein